MSLIADALKAAQQRGTETDAPAARRAVAASVLSGAGGAVRAPTARGPASRSLGLAGAVFAVALMASAGVVALAPPAAAPRPISPPPAPARTADLPRPTAVQPVTAAPGLSVEQDEPAPDPAASSARGPIEPPVRPRPASEFAAKPEAVDLPGESGPEAAGRFRLTVDRAAAGTTDVLEAAVRAHRRGSLTEAVALYERAAASRPHDSRVHAGLGMALQAGGHAARARDALRRATELDPGDAGAWSALGAVLGALGEREASQAALGEAVRLDPRNAMARVNLANQFLAGGLTADARRLLDGVVRAEPHHAEAHYALGRLHESTDDATSAARHYRAFVEHAGARYPAQVEAARARIQQLSGAR